MPPDGKPCQWVPPPPTAAMRAASPSRERVSPVRALVAAGCLLFVGPLTGAVGLAALSAGTESSRGYSLEAQADIPADLLDLYRSAAGSCPGLSWAVVAAISKVETNHGRFSGARMLGTGDVEPWIVGPPLNGRNGTRAIADTDAGKWDRDMVHDRAVGPLQFIPETWRAFGVDANGDGIADPHNFHDAVHGAVRYLCAEGAGHTDRLRGALFAYNNAHWYVDEVLALAVRYAAPSGTGPRRVGGHALPVDQRLLNLDLIRRPHHDYPAWDVAVPIGTPLYAVQSGTVIAVVDDARCGRGVVIVGVDGARYTYCHADTISVANNDLIEAGTQIATSGNSGRSTGPHLHLQIHSPAGRLVCPQPLLEAWYQGRPATVLSAVETGCTS